MTRAQQQHLAFGAAAAALTYLLFQYWGVAALELDGKHSLFHWINKHWSDAGGDYSHAWLMPVVSLWVIWWRRADLAAADKRVSRIGLALLAAMLLLHWAAYRAQQPRLSMVALAGMLWAVPLYVYGWGVGRLLLFPAGYLLLCFCSYTLVYVTFHLRLLTSICAAGVLNGLAISSTRVGTAIYSQAGGGFNFDVADACSGLRSLMVMTALAAPYAFFTQPTQLRKWVLFVASVPLAVAANVVRIVTIAIVAQALGQEIAMKIYHDYSGYIVFAASVLLLTGAGALLNKIPLRRKQEGA